TVSSKQGFLFAGHFFFVPFFVFSKDNSWKKFGEVQTGKDRVIKSLCIHRQETDIFRALILGKNRIKSIDVYLDELVGASLAKPGRVFGAQSRITSGVLVF